MSNFQLIALVVLAVLVVLYIMKRNSRLKREDMD
jgi:hypothetical protein